MIDRLRFERRLTGTSLYGNFPKQEGALKLVPVLVIVNKLKKLFSAHYKNNVSSLSSYRQLQISLKKS